MTPIRLLVASTLAGAALSGCTTLGGNVKGNFACRAPDGICAPSSTIDDAALTLISGADGDRPIAPAGPYIEPPTEGRGFQKTSAPVRTRERVLRIVFPAQIDAAGRLHEQTAVHAVVEQGEWGEVFAASAVATTREDLAAAMGSDTLLAAVERADPPVIDTLPVDGEAPSVDAVARARAQGLAGGAPNGDPVGDIKDQVSRTLRAPRRASTARNGMPPAANVGTPPTSTPPSGTAAAQDGSPVAANASTPAPVRVVSDTRQIPSPKFATPESKAPIAAVAANPTVRAGLERGEDNAKAAGQDAALPVLRASAFPGIQP